MRLRSTLGALLAAFVLVCGVGVVDSPARANGLSVIQGHVSVPAAFAGKVSVQALSLSGGIWVPAGSAPVHDDGGYRIEDLPAQTYRVRAFSSLLNQGPATPSARWWGGSYTLDDAAPLTLARREQRTGVDIVMAASASIVGQVTTSSGPGTVSGGVISAYRVGDQAEESLDAGFSDIAPDGSFGLYGLAPGTYRVSAAAQGASHYFAPSYEPTAVTAVLGEVHSAALDVRDGGAVHGHITAGGATVTQGQVSLYRFEDGAYAFQTSVPIAVDGSYEATRLRPGQYRLRAGDSALTDRTVAVVSGIDVPETGGGVQSPTQDLALPLGGTLSGTVRGPGGESVAGVLVEAHRDGDPSTVFSDIDETDAAGHYAVPGLVPGDYTLRVERNPGSDYLTADGPQVTAVAGADVATDLSVERAGRISGRLTNAAGGPLTQVLVIAYVRHGEDWFGDGTSYSKSNGTYDLTGLAPGTHRVCFQKATGGGATYYGECYPDEPREDDGGDIEIHPGTVATGIDAQLLPAGPSLHNLTAPSIAPARVGVAVVSKPGTWNHHDRYTYNWTIDGDYISTNASHQATYVPVAEDAGHRLAVVVTDLATGYAATTAVSASVVVAPGTLHNSARPTIGGVAKVGRKLVAHNGTWVEPGKLHYAYAWFANGHAIAGAKGRSLVLTRAQLGKRVVLKITGTRTGYRPLTVASATTKTVTS